MYMNMCVSLSLSIYIYIYIYICILISDDAHSNQLYLDLTTPARRAGNPCVPLSAYFHNSTLPLLPFHSTTCFNMSM